MKLSEVKKVVENSVHIRFRLQNGVEVPAHFHVTEVGKVTKEFIDCGGELRKESVINFQLWSADDTDHRLQPAKFLSIIELSEKQLQLEDETVEVEYQAETIGKFGLDFDGTFFVLTTKQTDCLAKDKCGIPEEKPKVKLADLPSQTTCTPGSGCC